MVVLIETTKMIGAAAIEGVIETVAATQATAAKLVYHRACHLQQ